MTTQIFRKNLDDKMINLTSTNRTVSKTLTTNIRTQKRLKYMYELQKTEEECLRKRKLRKRYTVYYKNCQLK